MCSCVRKTRMRGEEEEDGVKASRSDSAKDGSMFGRRHCRISENEVLTRDVSLQMAKAPSGHRRRAAAAEITVGEEVEEMFSPSQKKLYP